MKQQSEKAIEARQAARRRRRRRRKIMRFFIVLAVLLLLVLVGTLVVLHIIGAQQSKRGETTDFLGVKAIKVEGDTRYTAEELIEESGMYVGQSLLAVNKVQAHDALLAAFPYLCRVDIGNVSFDTIRIRVEETEVLGAVETADGWMVVGENNHALELLPADGLPADILQIKGATLENEQIGEALLDERSLRICNTLVEAAQVYGLDNMTGIDITEKTNIALKWGAGLQVLLGNETNLTAQIQVLVATMPTLLQNNGENVTGRLDMTSYADDDPDNDKAIFTPQELLTATKPQEPADTDTTTSGDGETGNDSTSSGEATGESTSTTTA